jgi:hypothetical protein
VKRYLRGTCLPVEGMLTTEPNNGVRYEPGMFDVDSSDWTFQMMTHVNHFIDVTPPPQDTER